MASSLLLLATLVCAAPASADILDDRLAAAVAPLAGQDHMLVERAPIRGHIADPDAGPLTNLRYDARSLRFYADIPGRDGTSVTLTGRAFPAIEVPVPTARLDKGHVLTAQDLDLLRVRADRVTALTVTDPAEVIGLSTRRALAPNLPLRAVDLEKPRVIAQGEPVTLTLSAPGLTLTLRGKALSGGAVGDLIRVANLSSSRVIAAEITGPGAVRVAALP